MKHILYGVEFATCGIILVLKIFHHWGISDFWIRDGQLVQGASNICQGSK